jgi:hypothetical protein
LLRNRSAPSRVSNFQLERYPCGREQ